MSVNVRPWKAPGKYMVTIRFRWPDGSVFRDRPVIDARTETQARKWGEQRESEARGRGKSVEETKTEVVTVAEFAPHWVEKHAKGNLQKASAVDSKESILRIHILPFVGALPLDKVTDEVVAELRSKWIAGGYTYPGQAGRTVTARPTAERATINNRLSVLNAMLRIALEWKKIAAMPCRIRLLKRDTGKEAAFYEHGTYERLVEASAKMTPRYHAMVLLAGDGGLRRGEIIGLNLADVDFSGGRIGVRRSVFWKAKVKHEDVVKVARPSGSRAPPACRRRSRPCATFAARGRSTRTRGRS